MSGRKYFCVCDSNCKFETMTKEQILSAISTATPIATTEDGCLFLELGGAVIEDVDTGFITTIKESNAGGNVSVWVGTEAQFNALSPAVKAYGFIARVDENGRVYICTDDSLLAFFKRTICADHIKVGNEVLGSDLVAKLRSAHIVEAGNTADGWSYRKWSDGLAECWCSLQRTIEITMDYGGYYGSGFVAESFPFVFTEIPWAQVSGGTFGGHIWVEGKGILQHKITFEVLANVIPEDFTTRIYIQAKGRWK